MSTTSTPDLSGNDHQNGPVVRQTGRNAPTHAQARNGVIGALPEEWPLTIEDHQYIRPSTAGDSLGELIIPFAVPFGAEDPDTHEAEILTANISLTLAVDDWGEAWITPEGDEDNKIASIDLQYTEERAGERGGHAYWDGASSAQLPSGTYNLHIIQSNISMDNNADNASAWDYVFSGEIIAGGGKKTPECPCCVEGDGDAGGSPSPTRSRQAAANGGEGAGRDSSSGDASLWRTRSCGGTGVRAVTTENSMYWSFIFGSFRGMGGIPQGRIELMASDNLEGYNEPSKLHYNHPLASSVTLPEGGFAAHTSCEINRGAARTSVVCSDGESLELSGVYAGGGSSVGFDSVGSERGLVQRMTDGSVCRYSAQTGRLASYTSPLGHTLTAEEIPQYLQIIRNAQGAIRQIWNYWDGLVAIENIANTGYTISLYTASQISGRGQDGMYVTEGEPFKRFTVVKTPVKDELTIIEQTPGRANYQTKWNVSEGFTQMTQGTGSEAIRTRRSGVEVNDNLYQLTTDISLGESGVGRKAQQFYELYSTSSVGYLLLSRREGAVGKETRTTTYSYDPRGRKTREQSGDGSVRHWEYDSLGRETMRTEPWAGGESRETRTSYREGSVSSDIAEQTSLLHPWDAEPIEEWKSVYTYTETDHVKRVEKRTTAFGSTEEHVEITETWLATAPNPYARGRIHMHRGEDGMETHYTYEATSAHGALYTETRETKAGGALVPGQSERRILFITVEGNVAREESHVLLSDGTWELVDALDYEYDVQNRKVKTTRANGRVSERTSLCDGRPLWEKNEDGIETSYAYDSARQLIETVRSEVVDGEHVITPETIVSYTRDALGRALSTRTDIGPMSSETRVSYDTLGRLASTTDAENRITSYRYSEDELTRTVTLPSGGTLITRTHPDGTVLRESGTGQRDQAYEVWPVADGIRTSVSVLSANGAKHVVAGRTVSDGFGQAVRVLQAHTGGTNQRVQQWDNLGRLVREQLETLAPTVYEYDTFGNRVRATVILNEAEEAATPQNARITEYAYAKEKRAEGIYQITTTTTYTAAGTPVSTSESTLISKLSGTLESKTISTDARGNASATWSRYAAPAVRELSQTSPGVESPIVVRMADDFETCRTDSAGVATTQSRRYTAAGLTLVQTDARGNATTTQLDPYGRTLRITDAAGNATLYAYEYGHDQPVTVTDAAGNVTHYAYDVRERKTAEWGTGAQPVLYAYDDADRLLTLTTFRASAETIDTDPRTRTDGDTTTWLYHTPTGLPTRKTYPDGKREETTYDKYNRIASMKNARGQKATRTYDPLTGELTGITYANNTSPAQSYTYNHLGQLTSMTDAAGTRTFAYNAYNERESETTVTGTGATGGGAVSATLAETRDAWGRPSGYSLACNGRTVQTTAWNYNSVGQLSQVSLNELAKPFEYGYNPDNGLLETLSYPNSMTRQTSYEAGRDLVTRLAYAHPGATDALAQVSYAYDPLGRPTERQSRTGETAEPTHAYAYNSRSELTGETLRNGETDTSASAYAYDNIGNRTSAEEGSASAPTAYTANALNQYTGIQEGGATTAFAPTYNADGGMTKLKTATGIWNVTWNAENRPIKWVNPSAKTTIECAYDFMGRRCMKKVTQNGTVASHRLYLYRGYLLIAELDALNTVDTATEEGAATAPVVRKTWLWDPSEPTPTRPLAMTNFDAAGRPVETLYYAHDLLKNTIALFDGEGNERARYDYTAFGQTLARSGPAAEANPYRYSGEYADDELGLIYYNYRHYDPQNGRWISRDPIGENGGVNVYGFVGNCPSVYIDEHGLVYSVEINKKDCNIIIHIEYVVYAKKGDRKAQMVIDEKIIEIKKSIENEWNGFSKGCCTVTMDIDIKKSTKYQGSSMPDILRIIPSKIFMSTRNLIELSSDPNLINQSNVSLGKYMYLSIYAVPWVVAHETGHILGLRDTYKQEGKGKNRETTAQPGKKGRMMSEGYGKVHPEEIGEILKGIKCPCGDSQNITKK